MAEQSQHVEMNITSEASFFFILSLLQCLVNVSNTPIFTALFNSLLYSVCILFNLLVSYTANHTNCVCYFCLSVSQNCLFSSDSSYLSGLLQLGKLLCVHQRFDCSFFFFEGTFQIQEAAGK